MSIVNSTNKAAKTPKNRPAHGVSSPHLLKVIRARRRTALPSDKGRELRHMTMSHAKAWFSTERLHTSHSKQKAQPARQVVGVLKHRSEQQVHLDNGSELPRIVVLLPDREELSVVASVVTTCSNRERSPPILELSIVFRQGRA